MAVPRFVFASPALREPGATIGTGCRSPAPEDSEAEWAMKAVVVPEWGDPEVMRYQDVPDPRPGPGEVLLRVRAIGVNFADHLLRRGAYGPAKTVPVIPGLEAAGEVVETGPDVVGLQPGDRVFGWVRQSYAEQAVARADRLLPVPPSRSWEEVGGTALVFGTAWHALVLLARLQPGERVLVHAAGSGVGSAAIQVAHRLGGWVVATAGADWKLDRARELGASATVNYQTGDFADAVLRLTDGQGVAVALEGVGRATFAGTVRCLADEGRLVIYGSPSGARVELDTRLAIFRNLTIYGMAITTTPRLPETIASFRERGLPWLESGELRPIIYRVLPLAEAAEAHRLILSREIFGKVVLVP